MKKLLTVLTTLVSTSFLLATNITFQVNMSTYPNGATDSTSTVHVRGSFNGWGDANALTNVGGDYWSATISLTAGDTIYYKFTHTDAAGALTWEDNISNREYAVPANDTLIEMAYWDQLTPPYTPTDSIDVWFRVNMGGVIGYSGEQVNVRGSFNGWSGADSLVRESATSDFWSGQISMNAAVADTIYYKFTYDGSGGTVWEDNISNRVAYITSDTTLAWKWFDDVPATEEAIDTFNVTFIVNTSMLNNITDSTAIVYTSGTWDSWANHFDDILTTNGDYHSLTIPIEGPQSGVDVAYKFLYEMTATGAVTWEDGDNRTFTATGDTTIFRYFNDVAPFTPTDSIDIWFRVNMAGQVPFGYNGEQVDVRGNFNGWSAGDNLTRETADTNYWSGLVSIPDTASTISIAYKFTYAGSGGTVWEDNIGNRTAEIHQDTTLAFKYFDDVPPSENNPVTAIVYWTVDMDAYESMDLFSVVRNDTMQVRGGFNGWSSSALPDGSDINMTRIPGTTIYELAAPVLNFPGTADAYKYYIKLSQESLDLIQATNPYFYADMGYENPPTMGAGNRPFTFEGDPNTTQEIGLEYYNDIPPEGLIPEGQTIQLTFNVDMSTATLFDPATDTLWFLFKDEWAEYIQGYSIAENSHHPDLIGTDDDGDGIYTISFPITGLTPYSMVYLYEFGNATDGYISEGTSFDYGRYHCRYIHPTGGSPAPQWPSEYTFPTDVWSDDADHEVEEPPDLLGVGDETVPLEFSVSQNYPNPFNPNTEFRFALPEAGNVSFTIYNILGQVVVHYQQEFDRPGNYGFRWNGTDQYGVPVSSGVYIYEIKTPTHRAAKKMTLLK